LLITADLRANATGTHMDASEARAQLEQAHNLQTTFADTAQKHNAFVGKSLDKDQHTSPETMLSRPIKSLDETDQGIGVPEGGGAGTVPAFGRPDIVASAPGGIALLTPNDAHAAAAYITIAGDQDVSTTAGANYAAAVRSGISLFTYGDAKAKRSDKGIKLHAASGKFTMQAQSAELKAAADKDINISSTSAKVEAAASEHVLLTAGGAYVKIVGGNIQIHAPGSVQFKAAQKIMDGGASQQYMMPLLPQSGGELGQAEIPVDLAGDQHFILKSYDGTLIKNRRYKASTGNGVIEGFTDDQGRSKVLDGYIDQIARFELIDTAWDEHFVIRDPHGNPIANMRYKIKSGDGVEIEGITDEHGQTSLFTSDKVETIELFYIEEDFPADKGVG
jgi:uncharacterized protein (DUF2345 family)